MRQHILRFWEKKLATIELNTNILGFEPAYDLYASKLYEL